MTAVDLTKDKKEKFVYGDLSYAITGVLYAVHNELGPGFTEDIYHRAVTIELAERGINFDTEKQINVFYKGKPVGTFRFDLVVDNKILLELKAVSVISDVHREQVLTYLKASGMRLGILANFGEHSMRPERILNKDSHSQNSDNSSNSH